MLLGICICNHSQSYPSNDAAVPFIGAPPLNTSSEAYAGELLVLYSLLSSNACHACQISDVLRVELELVTYPSDSAAFKGTLGHLMYPVWRVSLERSPEMCTFSMRVTGFSAKRRHSPTLSLVSELVAFASLFTVILKYW